MQTIVVLLMFIGMALVMHGIYDEKQRALEENVRVEYRFLPRTLYDEQLSQTDMAGTFKGMFDRESPWFERTVGGGGSTK
jgi:hypothetical protein